MKVSICDICDAQGRKVILSPGRVWRWKRQGTLDVCSEHDYALRIRVRQRGWSLFDVQLWMKNGAPPEQVEKPEIKFVIKGVPATDEIDRLAESVRKQLVGG